LLRAAIVITRPGYQKS